MTTLILPLGVCIEIATWAYEFYNFSDRDATGRIQGDSHRAYGLIVLGTVLI